jgi:leucyl aminopeptidase
MNVRTLPLAELDDLAPPLVAVPVLSVATGGGDAADQDASGLVVLPDLPASLEAVRARAGARVRGGDGVRVTGFVEGAGPEQVVFVGLGARADATLETLRRFAGYAVRAAEELRLERVALMLPEGFAAGEAARAAAEGAVLAAWRFRELKTGAGETEVPASVTELVILVGDVPGAAGAEAAVREGAIVAEAENLARVLQSRPGNVATPSHLASEAERLAAAHGLEVDVLGPDRLREERMHALLAVSQGSEQEPRLIVLRHRGGEPGRPPLVLVGKGLTFDAGGISIKPAAGMEDMKYDMSGGAAVLAAMTAIARLRLRRNVVGIVPSSENLLSGSAMKPGDVLTTRSGRTVEVVNTDAEGRLILCDALDYALGLEPEAVVDCATLTGAVVIALGHHAMAVLGNDEALVEELRGAGERSGERCWPLPLWKDYRTQLESTAADLMNVGGRAAGTITAAIFLSEFMGDVPWAHLDIAGTAYGDADKMPYRRKGGYGVPTRLLVEWVRSRA